MVLTDYVLTETPTGTQNAYCGDFIQGQFNDVPITAGKLNHWDVLMKKKQPNSYGRCNIISCSIRSVVQPAWHRVNAKSSGMKCLSCAIQTEIVFHGHVYVELLVRLYVCVCVCVCVCAL